MIFLNPIEQFNLIRQCSFSSNYICFFLILLFIFIFCFVFLHSLFFNKKKLNFVNFQLLVLREIIYKINFKIKNFEYYNFSFFNFNYNFFNKNLFLLIEILFKKWILYFNKIINWNFSYIFFLFFSISIIFIFLTNLIGLIPYSFVLTAQITINLVLSFLIFISINYYGLIEKGVNFYVLFIPKGSNLFLHFLLIPIELISYLFRPISLSIRLFANIMSGHILLKVICFFFLKILLINNLYIFFYLISFVFLFFLYFLEFFVAVLQTYVFFVLICIFLNDILKVEKFIFKKRVKLKWFCIDPLVFIFKDYYFKFFIHFDFFEGRYRFNLLNYHGFYVNASKKKNFIDVFDFFFDFIIMDCNFYSFMINKKMDSNNVLFENFYLFNHEKLALALFVRKMNYSFQNIFLLINFESFINNRRI